MYEGNLEKSELQCMSNLLWHKYEASAPKEQIVSLVPSPYFIQSTENDNFLNAIGLIGLTLLGDSNLENQISGFNTFFSLYNSETLIDFRAVRGYAESGYKIYPVIVDDLQDLLKVVNIIDPKTKLVLQRIFNVPMPNVKYEAIYTSVKYGNHLRGLTSLRYPAHYTLVMSGIVYMLMIKELNAENHLRYMKKRWRLLCDFLNVRFWEAVVSGSVTYTLMPPHEACKQIYKLFSVNKRLRSHFFLALEENVDDVSGWGLVCKAVINEANFAELDHINLIIKHIIIQNPSISVYKTLNKEIRLLTNAFRKAEATDFSYLSIFLQEELISLLPRNFPNLLYLACKVPCQSNHFCFHDVSTPNIEDIETKKELDGIINSLRTNSVADAPRIRSTRQERIIQDITEASEYWRNALAEYEAEEISSQK